jgi:methylated-DNA-[protein]-cysteine S-methyltransferase
MQMVLDTPLGPLLLAFSEKGLCRLEFADEASPEARRGIPPDAPAWLTQALGALRDYFAGRAHQFPPVPLDLHGTPFQLQVWQELRTIPPGQTVSYGELARRLGRPRAARAVGQAVGANPVPPLVPCHRVIAAAGKLGGYSAGLHRKCWLLAHEGVLS